MSAVTAPQVPPVGSWTRRAVAVVPPSRWRTGPAGTAVPPAGPWARRAVTVAPPPTFEPALEGGAAPRSVAVARTSLAVAVARFAASLYLFVLVFLVLVAVTPVFVAGWQPLSVVSGSMQPAVAPGSLVMVQPAEPDQFYAHPTIVAFADPARPGQLLTHRVTATAQVDGSVHYTTKGDANRTADSDTVAHDATIGAVRMVIPFVGLPAMWLHNSKLAHLGLWLAVSVLAVGGLFVRVRP